MDRIKYNIWVFFARIRVKRTIGKLKQDLQDLSWHLCVEKNESPEILSQYKKTKALLYANEILLTGLQYD